MLAAAVTIAAIAGMALCRWTRLHPLLAGLAVGLVFAPIALIVAGGMMSEAAVLMAFVAIIIFGSIGALGAFAGWLRRKHRERIG